MVKAKGRLWAIIFKSAETVHLILLCELGDAISYAVSADWFKDGRSQSPLGKTKELYDNFEQKLKRAWNGEYNLGQNLSSWNSIDNTQHNNCHAISNLFPTFKSHMKEVRCCYHRDTYTEFDKSIGILAQCPYNKAWNGQNFLPGYCL